MRALPSTDPMDPGYRRLSYTRYADDHILGFIGPKAEAEEIKEKLAQFLRTGSASWCYVPECGDECMSA